MGFIADLELYDKAHYISADIVRSRKLSDCAASLLINIDDDPTLVRELRSMADAIKVSAKKYICLSDEDIHTSYGRYLIDMHCVSENILKVLGLDPTSSDEHITWLFILEADEYLQQENASKYSSSFLP